MGNNSAVCEASEQLKGAIRVGGSSRGNQDNTQHLVIDAWPIFHMHCTHNECKKRSDINFLAQTHLQMFLATIIST